MQRLLWGMLILVLVPLPSSAQTVQDSWDNLKQLRPGQRIEVVDMKWKSVKGTFVSVSEEAISLQAGKKETSLAREDVLRVALHEHSHRARNTLIGLAVGAGAGAALGYATAHGPHASNPPDYVGMLVTLPVCTGVGTLAGAVIPTGEQTIYRAKKPSAATTP